MVLYKMRRAADPSFALEKREDAADLGFQPILRQKTDCRLDADAAENGKFVGIFF